MVKFIPVVLTITVFLFFTNAGAANTQQEVYFVDRPLPKIVAELESIGKTPKEIQDHLKETLVKLTPELAQEKLGIRWIDNDLRQDYLKDQIKKFIKGADGVEKPFAWPIVYPDVAICYMGPDAGYALFAMDDIPIGTIIAEYTGSHVKNKLRAAEGGVYRAGGGSVYPFTEPFDAINDAVFSDRADVWEKAAAEIEEIDLDLYSKSPIIEEKVKNLLQEQSVKEVMNLEGNAAIFAQPILTFNALKRFGYRFFYDDDKNPRVFCLSELVALGNSNGDAHVVLLANADIKMFEQICFPYDIRHGYMPFEWQQPYLFHKNGDMFSHDEYQISLKRVTLADLSTRQLIFLYPRSEDELRLLAKTCETNIMKDLSESGDYRDWMKGFVIIPVDNGLAFTATMQAWEQQISRTEDRIIITGAIIRDEKRQKNEPFWETEKDDSLCKLHLKKLEKEL